MSAAPLPDARALYDVVGATWPAFSCTRVGPWALRDGRGGGKRTSAATAEGAAVPGDLPAAEAAMRALGEVPRFMIRGGDKALDALLEAAGYTIIDPVNMYVAALDELDMAPPAPTASFHVWEPLAIQREIWAGGGIGPDRIAVMMRAAGPKTALLGRDAGHAAATGFAAIHAGIAMVHALDVLPDHRRRGTGRNLMAEAAIWARGQGARHLAVICTAGNTGANALYTGMGMTMIGRYHYRQHPQGAA